jgi:glycosyltransferase involved in cell wall biosynthesis
MKRILLISTSYPDQAEGESAAGVFVRDFARALVDADIEVEVVAPALNSNLDEEGGMRVNRFAVPKLPLSLLNPLLVPHWAAIASTLVRGGQAVMNACERRRPDHILALWALPSGVWAQSAARKYGIGYSTWALGSDIWTLGKIPVVRAYLARILRQAVHRFADGHQLAAEVERISGKSCAFLPSSRDFGGPARRTLNQFPPYRLAFLGRWHPNKGIDLLLDALVLLDDAAWGNIEAVRIHGGGLLEQQVVQGVKTLASIGRPVQVGGYLDLAGARELFDWADFVLIPSRIESIPVVFSDAMQAGRPVIATPVGDLCRLVTDLGCGVLASAVEPSAIAQAITEAVTLSPVQFMSKAAQASLAFDVRRAAKQFLTTIHS